jgi:signal transduction histidine kinase
VEAADEQRRQVVRDLHDGAQQRLVEAIMTLQLAQARGEGTPLVAEGIEQVRAAIAELRELARGIHPSILTHRGLEAAVEALSHRMPLPVALQIPNDRYPPSIESAAYFVVAEALTNVAKYANAKTARVMATSCDDCLTLTIEDDGVGGAHASAGSGLSGLHDRITALSGTLTLDSPPGRGTRIRAEIPLP